MTNDRNTSHSGVQSTYPETCIGLESRWKRTVKLRDRGLESVHLPKATLLEALHPGQSSTKERETVDLDILELIPGVRTP